MLFCFAWETCDEKRCFEPGLVFGLCIAVIPVLWEPAPGDKQQLHLPPLLLWDRSSNLVAVASRFLEHPGVTKTFIVVCTVNLVLILTVFVVVIIVPSCHQCPAHAATSTDSESTDPNSDLGGSSGNHPAGDGRRERALRQPAPEWHGVWENLGRCLEQFLPPMACEFLPEQACNPAEMADHLKEGCLVSAKKRERLLVLC